MWMETDRTVGTHGSPRKRAELPPANLASPSTVENRRSARNVVGDNASSPAEVESPSMERKWQMSPLGKMSALERLSLEFSEKRVRRKQLTQEADMMSSSREERETRAKTEVKSVAMRTTVSTKEEERKHHSEAASFVSEDVDNETAPEPYRGEPPKRHSLYGLGMRSDAATPKRVGNFASQKQVSLSSSSEVEALRRKQDVEKESYTFKSQTPVEGASDDVLQRRQTNKKARVQADGGDDLALNPINTKADDKCDHDDIKVVDAAEPSCPSSSQQTVRQTKASLLRETKRKEGKEAEERLKKQRLALVKERATNAKHQQITLLQSIDTNDRVTQAPDLDGVHHNTQEEVENTTENERSKIMREKGKQGVRGISSSAGGHPTEIELPPSTRPTLGSSGTPRGPPLLRTAVRSASAKRRAEAAETHEEQSEKEKRGKHSRSKSTSSSLRLAAKVGGVVSGQSLLQAATELEPADDDMDGQPFGPPPHASTNVALAGHLNISASVGRPHPTNRGGSARSRTGTPTSTGAYIDRRPRTHDADLPLTKALVGGEGPPHASTSPSDNQSTVMMGHTKMHSLRGEEERRTALLPFNAKLRNLPPTFGDAPPLSELLFSGKKGVGGGGIKAAMTATKLTLANDTTPTVTIPNTHPTMGIRSNSTKTELAERRQEDSQATAANTRSTLLDEFLRYKSITESAIIRMRNQLEFQAKRIHELRGTTTGGRAGSDPALTNNEGRFSKSHEAHHSLSGLETGRDFIDTSGSPLGRKHDGDKKQAGLSSHLAPPQSEKKGNNSASSVLDESGIIRKLEGSVASLKQALRDKEIYSAALEQEKKALLEVLTAAQRETAHLRLQRERFGRHYEQTTNLLDELKKAHAVLNAVPTDAPTNNSPSISGGIPLGAVSTVTDYPSALAAMSASLVAMHEQQRESLLLLGHYFPKQTTNAMIQTAVTAVKGFRSSVVCSEGLNGATIGCQTDTPFAPSASDSPLPFSSLNGKPAAATSTSGVVLLNGALVPTEYLVAYESLQAELADCRKIAGDARKREVTASEEAEGERKARQSALLSVEDTTRKLAAVNRLLEKERRDFVEAKASLEKEIRRLEEQAHALSSREKEYVKRAASAENELGKARERLAAIESEKVKGGRDGKSEIEMLRAENAELEDQLRALLKEDDALKEALEATTVDNKRLISQLKEAVTHLADVRKREEEAKEQQQRLGSGGSSRLVNSREHLKEQVKEEEVHTFSPTSLIEKDEIVSGTHVRINPIDADQYSPATLLSPLAPFSPPSPLQAPFNHTSAEQTAITSSYFSQASLVLRGEEKDGRDRKKERAIVRDTTTEMEEEEKKETLRRGEEAKEKKERKEKRSRRRERKEEQEEEEESANINPPHQPSASFTVGEDLDRKYQDTSQDNTSERGRSSKSKREAKGDKSSKSSRLREKEVLSTFSASSKGDHEFSGVFDSASTTERYQQYQETNDTSQGSELPKKEKKKKSLRDTTSSGLGERLSVSKEIAVRGADLTEALKPKSGEIDSHTLINGKENVEAHDVDYVAENDEQAATHEFNEWLQQGSRFRLGSVE